jgi:hypothetical protein
VYSIKGEYENAISDLNTAVELDPHHAPALVVRGLTYADMGEKQQAISDLEQAIAIGLSPEEQASVEETLNGLTGELLPTPDLTMIEEVLSDDFTPPNDDLWMLGEFEGGETSIFNGGYRIEIFKENWAFRDAVANYSDVMIEANVENLGTDENKVGLMCRAVDGQNHYILSITSVGYFGIEKISKGEWQTLVWRKSDEVNTGKSSNHIKAVCNENNLSLFVNEVLLSTVTDNEFSEGLVGPFAGSYESVPVDVLFDNFSVSVFPP